MIIVYDTNFLSSLLKINRLEMVKVLFKEENLYIPTAVLGEITKTDLITNLLNLKGKEYSEFSEEDCVIVAVAHDEFMEIALDDLKGIMNAKPVFVDIRGMFEGTDVRKNGFYYRAL